MVEITKITPDFAIGAQLTADDTEKIRDAGFASILNARPDDEIGTYMLSDEARKIAEGHGLGYAFSPTEGHEIFEPEVIDRFERALADLPRPIFSHCKTGTRSAMLWALVAARHRDVNEVIATLRKAGQELDFLEDELHESAKTVRSSLLRLKDNTLMNLGGSSLLGSNPDDRDGQ